jgi:hypothetical protein
VYAWLTSDLVYILEALWHWHWTEFWANHRMSTSAGETTTEQWLQEMVQDVAVGGCSWLILWVLEKVQEVVGVKGHEGWLGRKPGKLASRKIEK